MPESSIDQELQAIRTIIDVLVPLDDETRLRALDYAMQHLGLTAHKTLLQSGGAAAHEPHANIPVTPPASNPRASHQVLDIRSLKEQKNPGSDIEMATLVAYYLKHEAPAEEQKEEIGAEDIETYFVQAGYPLPSNTAYTLPNAKKSGYLETASRGKYKLNSVGHNLVAHGMPRSDSSTAAKPKRKKKKARKATNKQTAKKSKKKSS